MEYQDFLHQTQQASEASQSGRLQEAANLFNDLFLSDISDIDKAAMCGHLANIHDRMGKTGDALFWFDKGVDLEQSYFRYELMEKKAEYLVAIGKPQDAVRIYESLITQPFVTEDEKERMRKTIQTFLVKTMHQWK